MGCVSSQAYVATEGCISVSTDPATTDVQTFIVVHLVTKLGTAANDAATSLKLLEKGLKKEDLALAVLIDFPFQIWFGYLAAKWSKGEKPLRPVRTCIVFFLFYDADSSACILKVAARHVDSLSVGNGLNASHQPISADRDHQLLFRLGRFLYCWQQFLEASAAGQRARSHRSHSNEHSTVQFVGISAFHTQIADPLIGGTYMTVRASRGKSRRTSADNKLSATQHS